MIALDKTGLTYFWGKCKAAFAPKTDGVEYVVGTHGSTATNVWTGVTRDSALYTGKTIAFYLTSAGNSSAATLNLTLSGGGTTGAKNVRINNSNVTTHFPQYSVVMMVYDGTYWKTFDYNSDTLNRAKFDMNLTAAEAITGGKLICGGASGYQDLVAGLSFGITYPILYAGTTIAKGATTGTRNNNYLAYNNINFSSTGTITSGAADKTIYLKGTLSGNTFTVATSPFLTTVEPTSDDGFAYIPLGMMSSGTNGYFFSTRDAMAFIDGKFQKITPSMSHIAPVENGTASANYAVGERMMVGSTLYKATTAIASGETITAGTNVIATTVTDELDDIVEMVDQNALYDLQVENNSYEGRDITTIPELAGEISAAGGVYAFLHARVAAGDYSGLRVRDYIEVPVAGYDTVRFDIGGFDPFYRTSSSAMARHILFVAHGPVTLPSSSAYYDNNGLKWNVTNTNNGTSSETNPYLASNLHAWEVGEFYNALPSALRGYIIDRAAEVEVRYKANNTLTSSTNAKWASLDKVWSLDEVEICGFPVYGTMPYTYLASQQLPMFRDVRDVVRADRKGHWLRVVSGSSDSEVCCTSVYGHITLHDANESMRPRPCFLLG